MISPILRTSTIKVHAAALTLLETCPFMGSSSLKPVLICQFARPVCGSGFQTLFISCRNQNIYNHIFQMQSYGKGCHITDNLLIRRCYNQWSTDLNGSQDSLPSSHLLWVATHQLTAVENYTSNKAIKVGHCRCKVGIREATRHKNLSILIGSDPLSVGNQ